MIKTKIFNRKRIAKVAGLALMAAVGFTSCEGYDLADKEPSWLGKSIYDYLDNEGNYTYTVKLIEDLGYKEVLAKTGSKTLFVADDDAFGRFFKNNSWGVSSYDQLTLAQKKLILYGSMINNACQVAYLSSSEGPLEGDCMRRLTSLSVYDSVPILKPEQMPNSPYWQYYKDENNTIPCFMDMSTPPMLHFIEAFLQNRLITNEDCDFLFNYQTKRQPGDANINGVLMVEQNIKCSNGFVHKMADVITSLPNMAEIINNNPETKLYASLLNRFCAPYYAGDAATIEYNRLYNTNVDSVFQKRYFAKRSQHGEELMLTPKPAEEPVNGYLKFDPGWNGFYSETNAGTSENVALQENMGVMLVPSDKALEEYWNNGGGKVLKDYYGSWENVPDEVVSKMIYVNMQNDFAGSCVPSKFNRMLNDAQDEIGIKTEDVDRVEMACNGAIYYTNKVFNPVAYISVSFPALINETMNIFNWAIEQCGYDVYLNSQQSYYSLFIPTNKAMLEYIDPCSFGKSTTQLFRFHYDSKGQTKEDKVWASIWNYDVETGVVGDSISKANYEQIKNRLEDILNTHIVIGNIEDGNIYYQTKGGSTLRIANAGTGNMTVQGSAQIDEGKYVKVADIYDQSKEGNGKTYILDGEPIQTTRKSVANILAEHSEYEEFYKLLAGSSFLETKHVIGKGNEHGCPTENISIFNTFRYTILVPTNESIIALQKSGELPTWNDVEDAAEDAKKDSLTTVIEDFIKYHIVDNSFYIGQGNESGQFETSAYAVEDDNLQYHKVKIDCSNNGLSITDACGNTRSVITSKPELYNQMAREYQYDSGDATTARNLYTSSYAVVHLIDGALNYKKVESNE